MFAEGVVRAGRGEAQSWGRRVGVGAEGATEPLAPSMGNGDQPRGQAPWMIPCPGRTRAVRLVRSLAVATAFR